MSITERFRPFLFAEGGDGGEGGQDGGNGAGVAVSEAMGGTGVGDQDAADRSRRSKRQNPLRNVQYGIQSNGEGAGSQTDAGKESNVEETWESVKKRYSKEFGNDVSTIVQDRLKNSKGAEETLKALMPALEAITNQRQLGVDLNTREGIDALVKAITDDDSLYEDEALQRGIPVEALKQIKQLERMQAENAQMRAEQEQRAAIEKHLQKLVQQAGAMQQLYPGFDLQTELNTNAEFARLTSPQYGIDVRTAYEVTHRDQINRDMMAFGVQKTRENISNAIASGVRRPSENGTQRSAAVDVRSDPRKLSRADREEIKRRAMRGEKIAF